MKKIVLSAAFSFFVLIASAQTSSIATNTKSEYTSKVSTDTEIRQMANQLQLNEGLYIRFRDLSKSRNEQLREAQNMYANDAAGLKKRVHAINQEFENQLAQNLSQTQYTAYLASQGRVPTGNNNQATGYGGVSLENSATGTSTNGGAVNTNSDNTLDKASDANKPMILNSDSQTKTDKETRKNKKRNKKNKNTEF
jgi:hypothetical protein